jgi:hypothetical protein
MRTVHEGAINVTPVHVCVLALLRVMFLYLLPASISTLYSPLILMC